MRWLAPCLALLSVACSSEPLENAAGSGKEPPGSPAETPGTTALGAVPRTDEPVVAYPSGPYGRGVGSIIDNLSFLGWRNAAAANYDPTRLEEIRLSDFYDPDGSKGIRVLALNASAVWCVVCRAEYSHLGRDAVYQKYRPKGVEILGVLFEDKDSKPATPSDLVVWGGPNMFDVPFPLVIDPGFKTGVYFSSDATPMNMLIDTRTMQIIQVTMGYDASRPSAYWNALDVWLGN